ncbi:MAG: hypothetical protein WA624_03825 [Methylocella sp.]
MSNPPLDQDTREPRRWLDKQEAARHLIHTAIRLIQKQEDPFATHLLIHSADKMLIDLAKNRGEELGVDWTLYIKTEYQAAFFEKMRATSNYLKHGNKDFADDLPVHDIMMINVTALFICITNYSKIFREFTNHVMLFYSFMLNIWPQILKPEAVGSTELLKSLRMTEGMTPGEFFKTFEENSQMLPKFYRELSKDLEDTVDFYHLSFRQLRAGETKSTRVFNIPEY